MAVSIVENPKNKEPSDMLDSEEKQEKVFSETTSDKGEDYAGPVSERIRQGLFCREGRICAGNQRRSETCHKKRRFSQTYERYSGIPDDGLLPETLPRHGVMYDEFNQHKQIPKPYPAAQT